jgi:hypothetical protein
VADCIEFELADSNEGEDEEYREGEGGGGIKKASFSLVFWKAVRFVAVAVVVVLLLLVF